MNCFLPCCGISWLLQPASSHVAAAALVVLAPHATPTGARQLPRAEFTLPDGPRPPFVALFQSWSIWPLAVAQRFHMVVVISADGTTGGLGEGVVLPKRLHHACRLHRNELQIGDEVANVGFRDLAHLVHEPLAVHVFAPLQPLAQLCPS